MKRLLELYSFFVYLKRKILNKYMKISILEDDVTISKITNEKLSMARFGDGELKLIIDKSGIGFQNSSSILSKRLEEILLQKENEKILIGIPKILKEDKEYTLHARLFWAPFIVKRYSSISKLMTKEKVYCNASITRPYIDYIDKSKSEGRFKDLKKLWENRNVLVVEGDKTLFGVGNDLLDNTKNTTRIICPSINAFEKYDDIYDSVTSNAEVDCLILIALGPTATILAYDLSCVGYQALDIGHIDIEYEWFKKNTNKKVAIEGKNVNEVNGKNNESDLNVINESYEKSILLKIQ